MTTLLEARRHVHGILRRSRTSFYWAMRGLPAPRREAIFALYALCRELDNLADGPLPEVEKSKGLADWDAELGRLFAGRPEHELTIALAPGMAEYDLPRAEFTELLEGLRMDAAGAMRAPSLENLELYCRRVAGSVGLLTLPILGATPMASQFALSLGTAMQFTNILRDLDEDAARGRLYLPRELLDEAGIGDSEAGAVLRHPRLNLACDNLAQRAAERYRIADASLPRAEADSLRPALLMMAGYRRLLDRLHGGPWPNPVRPRLGLGLHLWLFARSYFVHP